MKPKKQQQERQSIRSRALFSCGKSKCDGCYNLALGDDRVCRVCYKSYVDGYTKGWKASRRELR